MIARFLAIGRTFHIVKVGMEEPNCGPSGAAREHIISAPGEHSTWAHLLLRPSSGLATGTGAVFADWPRERNRALILWDVNQGVAVSGRMPALAMDVQTRDTGLQV